MATIGSFTHKPDGTFEGRLATLTMQARLRLVPLEEKTSDKAPDYRVYAGRVELGAAWSKETAEGTAYLSVILDDPSFAAPITAALFRTEGDPDRHVLVWNRPRRD
jgi:uncharacterized protein (DUF736 family)